MSGYPSSQPPHYVSSANGANGSSNYNAEQYRSRANSSASTNDQHGYPVEYASQAYYNNEANATSAYRAHSVHRVSQDPHSRRPSDPSVTTAYNHAYVPSRNMSTSRLQHSGASLPDFGQLKKISHSSRPLPQPGQRKNNPNTQSIIQAAPSFFHAKAAASHTSTADSLTASHSSESTHRYSSDNPRSLTHSSVARLNSSTSERPPTVELSILPEDLKLPEFSFENINTNSNTNTNSNIGGDNGAKMQIQIVPADPPPKHELTQITTSSSTQSMSSNGSFFQSYMYSNDNDNSQRLAVGEEPTVMESPLELPADIFMQYSNNANFQSGGYSNNTLESTRHDSHTTNTAKIHHASSQRGAIQKPPPLDMHLNISPTHSRSVSDGGHDFPSPSLMGGRPMAQAGPAAVVRSRAASEYRCNSLSSLNMSPVPRAISPLSGGFFGNGNSNGFYQSSSTGASSRKIPIVYPALLSRVADAFRMRVTLQTHYKDSLEYKTSFNGRDAVDVLCFIIKTSDCNLALLLGRALDAQRFFHDVTYDHRLRDNPNEIYQFREDAVTRSMLGDGHDNTQSPYSMDDGYSNDKNYADSPLPITTSESESIDLAPSALPNGVFTLLADCYSPTCTRETLCYSISCPRRLEQQARLKMQLATGLKRTSSRSGLNGERKQTLWIESVPKEISDSVPKEEQKRQEIIYEIIYTEKDFVDDLEILERLYMEPLRYANIIWDPAELEDFITQVFHNVSVIRQISTPLSQALLKRQEEKAVVERIGDIFLAHVDNFEPFVSYGAHQPYGKHHLDTATQKYHELPRWLEQRERMPESRKLPIQSFLARPTTRLARYPLLLEAAIKASPEGHPDREDLALAIEKIRVLLRNINSEAGRADTRIRLTKLNDELLCSPSDLQELALLNPERQLIREGTLKKRANVEQVEVTVFLFDHYLLLAKRRKPKDGGGYKVHKRPIPLEMLSLTIADEPALRQTARRTSSIFSGTKGINGGTMSSAPVPTSTSSATTTRGTDATKAGFPITLTHLGRNGMEVVLYASSQAERWQWREKIEAQREVVVRSRQIFNIVTLSDRHFHKTSRVNCSAVFNQGRKLVIGTDDGVYVGMEAHPDTMAKTLDLDKVHKIEILEDYNMVLILHDKNRTLTSYPMDCLMPIESSTTKRSGRKIKSHVSFFKVGVCMNRTLVCVVKSAALYSTINTLEPVSAMNNKKKSLGMILRNNETMKVYREFYIPTESSSIHFLKTKLCVGCNKGFEVVDLETLNTLGLLDPADEALNFVLRRESARPIAIFRIRNGDFLLCYDEFAFFVNKNGRRSRPNWLVTWEGEPSAFAINYPYILAFDSKFIEVRHVVTGELEQIIPTGTLRSLSTHSESIHCVTTGRNDYQHVFKLTRNPQIQGTSSNM